MFCPECGKNNQEGLANCAYCGALLEDNQPVVNNNASFQSVVTEKILPFIKKYKIIAISIPCVIIIIIAFFVIGSSINSPEHVAKEYVKNLISSNWSDAYKSLDLQETDLVNYDQFVTYQENNGFNYSEIKNYTVTEDIKYSNILTDSKKNIFGKDAKENNDTDSNNLIKTYIVSYVTSGASSEKTFKVNLLEQAEKTWLFYPTYKVSTEDMLGSYSIQTIEGATVAVDNINLTQSKETNDSELVTYNIPSAFLGTHLLVISHPQCENYETTIDLHSNDNYLTVDSLEIKKDVTQSLSSITEKTFRTLCNSALAKDESYTLNIKESSQASESSTVKGVYDKLASSWKQDDGTGLKSITLNDFTDNSSQKELNRNLTYKCSMNFTYDYVRLYKSWGSKKIVEQSSSYSRTGYVTIKYVYDSVASEWLLDSVDNYSIYY